jgi:hypothetical protein
MAVAAYWAAIQSRPKKKPRCGRRACSDEELDRRVMHPKPPTASSHFRSRPGASLRLRINTRIASERV